MGLIVRGRVDTDCGAEQFGAYWLEVKEELIASRRLVGVGECGVPVATDGSCG